MQSSIIGFAMTRLEELVSVLEGRAATLKDLDRVEELAMKFNKKS